MVDVELGCLGALEEHGLACAKLGVEQLACIDDMLANHVRIAQVLVHDAIDREGGHIVDVLKYVVLDGECRLELLMQDLLIEQVLDANADTRVLVLVTRADAALGRADLVRTQTRFGGPVEDAMIGHDDMGVAADEKPLRGNALFLEALHLAAKHLGVDDASVADERRHALVHDARRNEVQGELGIPVDDGVASVIAALEANDVIVTGSEQVRDLALSLVAPLSAY